MERWLCLSVTVPHEAVDAVSNFLAERGSLGVIEGEHDPAAPQSPTTTVRAFFTADSPGPALRSALRRYLDQLAQLFPHLDLSQPVRLSTLGSRAWQDRWREHFQPLEVGSRFVVLPPWETAPTRTQRDCLVINPSMAFGTGHHATTRSCLEAVEALCLAHGAPSRALDLGTGSGILSIALARLGCPDIWALDTDPVALDEARKNLAANRITSGLRLSVQPLESLSLTFPLIVANLFARTLIELAAPLTRATMPGGHLILSGIQTQQAADVDAAFPAPVWREQSRLVADEWVSLVRQRV